MRYNDIPIDWPLDKNIIRRGQEIHTFGMVRTKADGSPRAHQGWDLYATPGTPCYTISDGIVEYVGTRGALGLLMVLSIEKSRKFAAYAHLSEVSVTKGDRVMLGQLVARTGNSGNAINMRGDDQHLHFEIRNRPITGLGLTDRVSPMEIFGTYPLKAAALRGTKS